MSELLQIPLIFLVGAAAGFINIMAGGGSVLTLGTMMLLGLPASVANGTNRIGILIESVSAAAAYKSERFSEVKESLKLGVWTIPGALLGSYYAISISSLMFQRILAVVMIFVVITLFLPKSKSDGAEEKRGIGRFFIYPAMLGVGIYGGFIQAGVGFLLMASLRHILKLDLVKVNMHKIYVVLIYTLPVLFIFGFTGNIYWTWAVSLSAGMAVGAWLSVKISIRRGEKVVKIVLCVAILIMAAKFLSTW